MAILGSHNSMTYMPPKCWLMRLFTPFWRCQNRTLKDQFASGVRCFDIRLRFKNDKWMFAHGATSFDIAGVFEPFEYLEQRTLMHKNEKLYIRLILEESKPNIHREFKFKALCEELQEKYKNTMIFFEGRRKFDWVQLYDFDGFKPNVIQYVGSMRSWYGKICPWLYWKLNGKRDRKKIANYDDNTIVLYDFI